MTLTEDNDQSKAWQDIKSQFPVANYSRFREVKQSHVVVGKVGEPSKVPKDSEHLGNVTAIGITGLLICVGGYFKPLPDYFFPAHFSTVKPLKYERPFDEELNLGHPVAF